MEKLKAEPIPLPPLSEQTAIARYLDYVDRRVRRYIKAKRRLIEVLTEQKQAIIYQAVTRGLDPDVPMKESGVPWLGEVPAHWEVKRLKHLSPEITVGVVVNPSSYFSDSGIPMLLGNNVRPGRFKLDNVRRISPESNKVLKKSQIYAGDIIVVRVGAPGVAAVVPDEMDGYNCASMMIIRRGREVESKWIEHLFNSPVMSHQIDLVKYGAAQKQFNIAHIVEFLVLVPGLEEQRKILAQLDHQINAFDLALHRFTSEIDLIREYRTRLIADVVTGKVDVRGVAASLGEEAGFDMPLDKLEDRSADQDEAWDEEEALDADDGEEMGEEVEA